MTNTEMYVYQKIAQNPGISHKDILGNDKEGAERRRSALLSQGNVFVRSKTRPYTYRLKTQEDATTEATPQLVETKKACYDYNPLECPGPLCTKFRAFHARRPDVFIVAKELARKAQSEGATKYSILPIIEKLRWDIRILSGSDPVLRVRYGRLLSQEAEFKNLFNPRKSRIKNC